MGPMQSRPAILDARLRAVTGVDPVEAIDAARLDPLMRAGFLEIDATHLRATPEGRQRLNALLERLVA